MSPVHILCGILIMDTKDRRKKKDHKRNSTKNAPAQVMRQLSWFLKIHYFTTLKYDDELSNKSSKHATKIKKYVRVVKWLRKLRLQTKENHQKFRCNLLNFIKGKRKLGIYGFILNIPEWVLILDPFSQVHGVNQHFLGQ